MSYYSKAKCRRLFIDFKYCDNLVLNFSNIICKVLLLLIILLLLFKLLHFYL